MKVKRFRWWYRFIRGGAVSLYFLFDALSRHDDMGDTDDASPTYLGTFGRDAVIVVARSVCGHAGNRVTR